MVDFHNQFQYLVLILWLLLFFKGDRGARGEQGLPGPQVSYRFRIKFFIHDLSFASFGRLHLWSTIESLELSHRTSL